MKTVIVLGCDGYIGHALTLRLLEKGYEVYGIDDFQRRKNVAEMKSFSATAIQTPEERHKIFQKIGRFHFLKIHLAEIYLGQMLGFLKGTDPIAIVNLAQMPSAPFSMKSCQHTIQSTNNNIDATLNVLYWMKEFAPDAQLVQIGTMGEYDPAAGTDIPEGTFDLEWNGKIAKNVIFPRRPGSFYHASKVASTYLIDCASRWWNISATDIMQGVVYGNWTPEIEKYNCHTRLDSDESFGTVINRFVVQAIIQHPLTVFGEGEQKRGYLALNDSVQCLMLAIENPPKKGEYRTWNQLDTVYAVNELAKIVQAVFGNHNWPVDIKKIPTPRAERTDNFHYVPYTEKLKELGFKPSRNITDEIEYLYKVLFSQNLSDLWDVAVPKITWK